MRDGDKDFGFLAGSFGAGLGLLGVETFFWRGLLMGDLDMGNFLDLRQKDLRIRAALSLSLSSDVGQKVSEPHLFDALFIGTPSFWPAQWKAESRPVLLSLLALCQLKLAWSGCAPDSAEFDITGA